jgi:basic amino acid/polyamine antiporter, APA family
LNTILKDEGLKRVIGVRALAINAVNLTVGAGIFALPAIIAGHLGAHAVWAYGLCGLLLGLVLLCFAEVGSKITVTGGVYAYVESAFGPLAGFLVNTLFWLGFAIMSDAAVANVLVDNLAVLLPVFKNQSARGIFMAILFGSIGLLNIIGTKESSYFVIVVTLIKLLPLVLLITIGWMYVKTDNLILGEIPLLGNFGEAALVLFFAFGGGAEATLTATGEIKNPKHTIPRGLLLGTLVIFFIYVSIQLVAQGILGSSLALQHEAPLAAAGEVVFGNNGTILFIAAAAFSCFSMISGDILVTSRLPYAAARDGLLPQILAKIHPRFATPHYAIGLYAATGFVLSISGGFRQLAILSSAAILIIYVGVILATIKLRKTKSENSFVIPGGLTVPVLALLVTGWFLSNLAMSEVVAVILFLLVTTVVYFLRRWFAQGGWPARKI